MFWFVPFHFGIHGNKLADSAAKYAKIYLGVTVSFPAFGAFTV